MNNHQQETSNMKPNCTIPIKPVHCLCEECIEYVCLHTYPLLSLEDNCPICMETMNATNVAYMSACGHRFHRNCISTYVSYDEVSKSAALAENLALLKTDIKLDTEMSSNDKSILVEFYNRRYMENVLDKFVSPAFGCPYCKIESKDLLSYQEVFCLCCNSVMPKIGSVSMGYYHALFNHYKVRLHPTPEMLDYLRQSKELVGEANLKTTKRELLYLTRLK